MVQTPSARILPGKIMAATGARHPDIIDAEFETISGDDRKYTRNRAHIAGLTAQAPPAAYPTRLFARPGGVAFWIVGIALAASAFWISGGYSLARNIWPRWEAGALTISGLTARIDASGARPLLLVDGSTSNEGTEQVELPFLSISVSAGDGSVTRYKLGTSAPSLGPGERFAFSSRLDVPRSGVRSVSVTFAE